MKKNREKAVDHFFKGLDYEERFDRRCLTEFKKAAELGYPEAYFSIENLYEGGSGGIIKPNPKKAAFYRQKAVEARVPSAVHGALMEYLKETPKEEVDNKWVAKEFKLLTKADASEPCNWSTIDAANVALCAMYARGNGVKQSWKESLRHWVVFCSPKFAPAGPMHSFDNQYSVEDILPMYREHMTDEEITHALIEFSGWKPEDAKQFEKWDFDAMKNCGSFFERRRNSIEACMKASRLELYLETQGA